MEPQAILSPPEGAHVDSDRFALTIERHIKSLSEILVALSRKELTGEQARERGRALSRQLTFD